MYSQLLRTPGTRRGRFARALLLALSLLSAAHAQWQNLNPGAGGQIQQIVADPNTPGRLFVLSDMEGVYRTDNHGSSWNFIGAQSYLFNNAIALAVEKGNANRLYLGTTAGLQISDDGGISFNEAVVPLNLATDPAEPIQVITIDPSNDSRIYAGVGGTFRWSTSSQPQMNNQNQVVSGTPYIWRSTDHGVTWTKQILDASVTNARKEVFGIAVHPTNSNIVYVSVRGGAADNSTNGSGGGVYRSADGGNTWTRLPVPAGMVNSSWGLTLSPDGSRLYALYSTTFYANPGPGVGRLWSTPTASLPGSATWTNLTPATVAANTWDATTTSTDLPWWNPVIDPRSSSTQHKILIGQPSGARTPLYEVTVNLSSGSISSSSWACISAKNQNNIEATPWEVGWERYGSKAMRYTYTPTEWGGTRGIWTTHDQTLYRVADTSVANWQNQWQNRYTSLKTTINGIEMWQQTGWHSTYNWDVELDGSYGITGNADNGVVESYDGGLSWTIEGFRRADNSLIGGSRCNAVAIVRNTSTRIVLAHRGTGYGAASTDGALYAKRLTTGLPRNGSGTGDAWYLIAGGSGSVGGFGNNKITAITADPINAGRVYFAGVAGGIWVIDDINAVLNQAAAGQTITGLRQINPVSLTNENVPHSPPIQVDPLNGNVIYTVYGGNLMKGTRGGTGSYTWTTVTTGVDAFTVWNRNGTRYIAITTASTFDVRLSTDGGVTFTTVLTSSEAVGAGKLKNPLWYQRKPTALSAFGLAASGDTLIVEYGNINLPSQTAGVFKGVISSGTSVTWTDWTGDLILGLFVRSRIVAQGSDLLYIGATAGTGVWGRTITNTPASYTLSVSATNGSVTRSPNQSTYTAGTAVQLTATPNTGYSFAGWSGDLSGAANPATLTMDSNKSVTALFSAQVAAQVADTFSYAAGVLEGKGTVGANWTSAWVKDAGTGSLNVNTAGLTYAGMTTAGGRIEKTVTGTGQNLNYSRTLNAGTLFNAGNSAWFAFLVRPTNTTGGLSVVINNGGGSSQGFGVRVDSGTVIARIGNTLSASSLPVPANTTTLVVGRIDVSASGNETVTIWTNPDLAVQPSSGGVSVSASYTSVPNEVQLVTYNQSSTWQIDELRVGSTYYSVTP